MNLFEIQNSNLPRIAVLFGGNSPEYPVSLSSGSAVLSAVDVKRFTPVPIGISRDGSFFLYTGDYAKIADDSWLCPCDCRPVCFSGQQSSHGFFIFPSDADDTPSSPIALSVRAALPILHGKNGEDGTVQGLLSLLGIPVIGCGTLCSSLCMDKERAHRIASSLGIAVPKSYTADNMTSAEELSRIADALSFPLFVKPLRAGSSFGVTCVQTEDRLLSAVKEALAYDTRILLEERIEGFEVGCAVMGRNTLLPEQLIIGDVDEIELADGFFDYTEKYTLKTSKIHVPARIPSQKAREIKETAARLYLGLDCDFFARVDLFLTPEGRIYFNEINTIPGFTSHSRFPGMMKSRGIPFSSLVNQLIEMEVSL